MSKLGAGPIPLTPSPRGEGGRLQVLIGVASVGAGLSLAAVVYYFSFGASLLEPMSQATAQSLAWLLGAVGMTVGVQGSTITSGAFGITIAPGCTPAAPLLLYLGAVAGYPSTWPAKLKGALLGIVCLTAVNFVRVTTLFFIGKYSPNHLEVMHTIIWQSLLILATLGLWLYWVQRYAAKSRA